MPRKIGRNGVHNPHRAARFRKEAERRWQRRSIRILKGMLIAFDVSIGGYSAVHYFQTGHPEVLTNFITIGLVTVTGLFGISRFEKQKLSW